MSENGNWIKLYRKTLDNPTVMKDGDHLAIWVWLLMKATWCESDCLFDGKRISLKPGQLPPISRRTIASELQISESKVQRVLKSFENEHQIEQQMGAKCRLISIVSWDSYQEREPQTEQQVNTKRTTSEPQVNTIKEYKNKRIQEQKKDIYSAERIEIVNYLNEILGSNYRPNTKKTKDLIHARLSEGFTVEDFKTVIHKKAKQWQSDPKMIKFLRPETLFGSKFEGYLNEKAPMTFAERWELA